MNLSLYKQMLKQMRGIIQLEQRYHGTLPEPATYTLPFSCALPFQGAWTVVQGGVTKETSHSWDIPLQRYAYDFVILDAQGHSSHHTHSTAPSAFYCYGREILAPACGIIAEIADGAPDSPISRRRRAACKAGDLRGNFVLIDHGDNIFSLLCHLKAHSIRVSVGQCVNTGDVLAACGNSGNSSEPHLHFQLQLGNDFCTAPGLPITFANISTQPTPHYARFDPRPCETVPLPYITRGQTVRNLN